MKTAYLQCFQQLSCFDWKTAALENTRHALFYATFMAVESTEMSIPGKKLTAS